MKMTEWIFHFEAGSVKAQFNDPAQNAEIEKAINTKGMIGIQTDKGCTYVNMQHVKVVERIEMESMGGDIIPLLPVAAQVVAE